MGKIKVSKDLLKIKDLIGGLRRIKPESNVNDVLSQLKEMNGKIEKIESELNSKKQTHMRLKRKKQIIFLLKQHKKLTSSGVGDLLKLSRTATNEYLKEMETEGLLHGENVGKEKFYSVANGDVDGMIKDEENNRDNFR
ncbi:MAG: winged helix-turn-helix transcriptional regulator [archaeon]